MIINRWMGTECEFIEGLSQEATPRSQWPYEPDWIVSSVRHDTGNAILWIQGTHRNSGELFYWGHYWGRGVNKSLDWRYDLTNASFGIGRHETPNEARIRHFARPAAVQVPA